MRLFADSERSNPFIPSIYLDTDHLAQRINDPLVYLKIDGTRQDHDHLPIACHDTPGHPAVTNPLTLMLEAPHEVV